MTPSPAVEWRQVGKDFSSGVRGTKLRALDDFSMRVLRGEVVGLLGSNGSGKSTAIKVALGLVTPSRGECRLFGESSSRANARRAVGYLPESPRFYRFLTGRELVIFHGQLCGLGGPRLRDRAADVLAAVGLDAAADRKVGDYSTGMLQRVGLAQALINDPQLIVLDEPTAGVDRVGIEQMIRLLLKFKAGGKTIVLTSHVRSEIEAVCDRVIVLEHGKISREEKCGEWADRSPPAGQQLLRVDRLTPAVLADLGTWLEVRGSALREVQGRGLRVGDERLGPAQGR